MRKLDPGNGKVCVPCGRERKPVSIFYFQSLVTDPVCLPPCSPGKSWDCISETAASLLCWVQSRACYRVLIVMDREPETGYWSRLLVAGPPVHIRKMFSWLPFLASLPSHGLLSGGLQPIIGASSSSLSPNPSAYFVNPIPALVVYQSSCLKNKNTVSLVHGLFIATQFNLKTGLEKHITKCVGACCNSNHITTPMGQEPYGDSCKGEVKGHPGYSYHLL